jgi:hypothetical protein
MTTTTRGRPAHLYASENELKMFYLYGTFSNS